jgi:hypothetical protein
MALEACFSCQAMWVEMSVARKLLDPCMSQSCWCISMDVGRSRWLCEEIDVEHDG